MINYKPMLLKEIDKPFNDKNYIYEVKYDGIRAIIYASKKNIKIISRNNIDLTNNFPELKEIKTLVTKKTIFDGEIIAIDNGKPSFTKLQTRNRLKNKTKIKNNMINNPVTFMCFDILYLNKPLINKTLLERKKILNTFKDNNVFIKTFYIEEKGIELFRKIKKLNLEGIIAKKKDSKYIPNIRTNNWIKIKNLKNENFYIGGYIEKKSKYVISLLLGEKRNNKLYYVGNVTMGNKHKLYKLLKNIKKTKSYFVDNNKKNINYIKPNIMCNINYLERTKNNHLRQPIYKKTLTTK